MNIRLNEWSKLYFVDPAKLLPELRTIQVQVANSDLKDQIKNLRTQKFKQYREGWEAAIFCFGMSQLIGVPIYIASHEASDYDAVALRIENATQHYTPIQIKELIPEVLNPLTDINKEIAKLNRYPVSNDTAIVIHVNRNVQLQLSEIVVPKLNIAELWLMGASKPDQSKWFIAGDLLSNPNIFEFDYPTI